MDADAGLFRELDQNAVIDRRLPYSADEVARMVRTAAEQARGQGITTCVDAGNGLVGELREMLGAGAVLA